MLIVGIDPGPDYWAAYVAIDYPSLEVKYHGGGDCQIAIRCADIEPPTMPFAILAYEDIQSYGMAVGASVFSTCKTIGRLETYAMQAGLDMRPVLRTRVKAVLCGSTTAKDANVRARLCEIYRTEHPARKDSPLYGVTRHKWAALAVAVAVAMGLSSPQGTPTDDIPF